MVDFFGYTVNVVAFVIYVVFVLLVFAVLRWKKFSFVQCVWLSVVSLAFLEVFWESPVNVLGIISSFHFGTLLRQLVLMFPVYLWFYYNWRFGDWRLSFVFVPAVMFEVGLILLGVMYFDGVVNRLFFFSVALLNVYNWRFSL